MQTATAPAAEAAEINCKERWETREAANACERRVRVQSGQQKKEPKRDTR